MSKINEVVKIEFSQLGDERGNLVVLEGDKNIPFAIKRVFYIFGTKENVTRGQHANQKTEFVLVNVAGTSKVSVMDCCGNTKEFVLDKPHTGLYLPAMVWKDMYDFSKDSILLVLASEAYDKSEYIRDKEVFMRGGV